MYVYLSSGAGGGCVEPEESACRESALKYLSSFFYASLGQSGASSIVLVCAQLENFFFDLCHFFCNNCCVSASVGEVGLSERVW